MNLTKIIKPAAIATTLTAIVLTTTPVATPVQAEDYPTLGACISVCVQDPTYKDSKVDCVRDCKAGTYQPAPTGLPGDYCTSGSDCQSGKCDIPQYSSSGICI